MTTLKIIHNAGFFSCSTVALQDIHNYAKQYGKLPDEVDRSQQYEWYKDEYSKDLIPYFFGKGPKNLHFTNALRLSLDTRELQFSDYKLLDFNEIIFYRNKYFTVSDTVASMLIDFVRRYNINLDNTCSVFYRGNDKAKETTIAPYAEFVNKAREIRAERGPNIQFLVQPDEAEFLEVFLKEFPDAIFFKETPNIRRNKESNVFSEMPKSERAIFAARFLAAVIIIGNCSTMITHSGNGGLWAAIYGGLDHRNSIHQYLNGEWI
jgi:hypothetical protein